MAITNKPFASFITRQFNGSGFDWDAVTLKATLHNSSVVPNRDTHDFFNDLSASELTTGTGYTQGGQAITVASVAYDSATRQVRLLASAATVWTGITKTGIRYIIVRRDTGSAATSELISVIDLETDQSVDGTLTVTWDATGVGRLVLPA